MLDGTKYLTDVDGKSQQTEAYLKVKGVLSLGGMVSPKKAASSANFKRTRRSTSPKYIPEISFSKI